MHMTDCKLADIAKLETGIIIPRAPGLLFSQILSTTDENSEPNSITPARPVGRGRPPTDR